MADVFTDTSTSQDSALARERLGALLASRADAHRSRARSAVLAIRERGADPPLFCVLGGGAGLPSYQRLAERVGDVRMLGLQITGAIVDDPVIRSVEKMAELHLIALREAGHRGPYMLCGHSMAAIVALELAQRLLRAGEQVPLLILIDQAGPAVQLSKRSWLYWQWASISRLPWRQRWNYIVNAMRWRFATSGRLPSIIRRLFISNKTLSVAHGSGRVSAAEYRRRMTDAALEALNTYHPEPYHKPIALLRAKSGSSRILSDVHGGWGSIAANGIRVIEIPGHHMNIFQMPHVLTLADEITALCNGARIGEKFVD